MARLSSENFSNPSTPVSARKSSRFKDLFKSGGSRTSLSPGSSAGSPEPSPLGDDHLKAGFTKVGLLPSERSPKFGHRKKSKGEKMESRRESLEKQAAELKVVEAPHEQDTALKASAVSQPASLVETEGGEKYADAEEKQGTPNRGAEELIKRREQSVKSPQGIDENDPHLDKSATSPRTQDFEEASSKTSTQQSPSQKDEQRHPTRPLRRPSALTITPKGRTDVGDGAIFRAAEIDSIRANTSPLASTFVDESDALTPKDASDFSQKKLRTAKQDANHPNIRPTRDISKIPKDQISIFLTVALTIIEDTPDAVKIGPLYITKSCLAAKLHRATTLTYLFIFFASALMGPKTLLVALWRVGCAAVAYSMARQQLGWEDDEVPDMLLGPLETAGELFLELGLELLVAVLELFAPAVAGVVQKVEQEREKLRSTRA